MTTGKFFTHDSKGERSITRTVFILSSLVVNVKFLFEDLTIRGFKTSPLSGTEYAVALGAAGAIYVLRKAYPSSNTAPKESEEK